jgi:hypothetical protein
VCLFVRFLLQRISFFQQLPVSEGPRCWLAVLTRWVLIQPV